MVTQEAKPERITLATLGGGGLVHDVDRALEKLCEDIADPDTETEAARKITITIEVTPDKQGQTAYIEYGVRSKLAGSQFGHVVAWIGMDSESRQLCLFDRQPQLFTRD